MSEGKIDALLDAMTVEEQISLLAGKEFWTTVPVPRLGIPSIKVSDGPNGARGSGAFVGGVAAAAFPVGVALAASWNVDLVGEVGAALAREAKSKGARVLLAPTVNMHRSTLNGRNFECYSEDPFLTSEIAVAYIRGLQANGVGATVKHFIGNESEYQRTTMSSDIDERTLREIYMPPFEAAVKRAGTWALMTSYNRLDGTYVSERADIVNGVLKAEWGYDGLVMSDWFGTKATAAALNAGLDLEMPGPGRFRGEKLIEAYRAGDAPAPAIRESARRVLRLIERVRGLRGPGHSPGARGGSAGDPCAHPPRRRGGRGVAEERRGAAAVAQDRKRDRGPRAERQDRAGDGRRQRPAQSSLSRHALRRLARRSARRGETRL